MNVTTLSSVVYSDACEQLENTTQPFLLILKKGENLFEGIRHCAQATNLNAAILSGIGVLENVSIAYYDLQKKEYKTKLFPDRFELVSLNGNIAFADGKHFIHIHAALATEEYQMIGGHIMDATIGIVGEISVTPLAAPVYRKYDEKIGLKLICPLTE